MTMHRYTYKFLRRLFLLVVYSVLLAACAKNELVDLPNVGELGKSVKVSLSFSVSSLTTPPSATSSNWSEAAKLTTESGVDKKFNVKLENSSQIGLEGRTKVAAPLYNLWVLQFNAAKILVKASKMPNTPEPVKELITIDADLVIGNNQSIYLVCLGDQYGSVDLSTVRDISELGNFELESIRYVEGVAESVIQQDKDIPYLGSMEGVDIILLESDGRGYVKDNSNSGFVGRIPMRAMVSKITFNFSYDVADLAPSILSLNNVPTSFSINPPVDYKPNNFVSLSPIPLDGVSFVSGNRYEVSWYVAPNRQGEVSAITKQEERYYYVLSGVATGTAPVNGTYINIWAADKKVAARYALYYIFVGGNTTKDFNVNPQVHHILRSDINTAPSENDKRVIYSTLQQKIDFHATEIIEKGSLPTQRFGQRYNLDASAGRRPIEITALRGSVTVDIVEEALANPLDVNKSWMQLSTSSNYTEALNRKNRGDKDALTTNLKIKTDIPGLIKLYLYNDDYEDYTTDVQGGVGARSLLIRFTFSSLTQPDDVYIYNMKQAGAFYVGRLGGDQDPITGVYSHGLVMSNKFNLCAEDYLSYHTILPGTTVDIIAPMKILKAGAYPDLTSFQMYVNQFAADNAENGKITTMLYSENQSAYMIMERPSTAMPPTTIRIPAPNRVKGKLDLYQYQGKYNRAEGFAARWCYDKNRDKNGDGEINYLPNDPINNEMIWYLPSVNQLRIFGVNYFGTLYFPATNAMIDQHLLASTFHSNKASYRTRFHHRSVTENDSYEVRCVRDVQWPVTIKHGKQPLFTAPYVEVVDGYAVINASGLVAGAAAYKMGDNKYITAEGRNVRHVEPQPTIVSIGAVTSARFRVAPHNITRLGIKTTDTTAVARMTWAEAAGYNTATNDLVLSSPVDPADVGCAMYAGISSDPILGKWRLPTLNEMMLIYMMAPKLLKTTATTGYTALSYLSAGASTGAESAAVQYWTSTEYYSSTVNSNGKTYAWSYREDYEQGVNKEVVKNNHYPFAKIKTTNYFVRCVQDIP